MEIKVGNWVYWARVRENTQEFDVIDLKIATIYDTYFVCTDEKTGQRHLFSNNNWENIIFPDRHEALELVLEAQEKSEKEREKA